MIMAGLLDCIRAKKSSDETADLGVQLAQNEGVDDKVNMFATLTKSLSIRY